MAGRIAIVSDVHANLVALEAVLADLEEVGPDLVVQGGDLVGMGPRPAECADRIRELGWPSVAGNWERVVAGDPLPPEVEPERAPRVAEPNLIGFTRRHGQWTADRLGSQRVRWLAGLPLEWRDNHFLTVVHAVPGDTWPVVPSSASDMELRATFAALDAARVAYCHTHVAYVRDLGSLTIANAGSAGAPLDGDPRLSYLIVEHGSLTLRRVEYDVEQAVADLKASAIPDVEWVATLYRTAAMPPLPA